MYLLKAISTFALLSELEILICKYNLLEWMSFNSSFSKKYKLLIKLTSLLAKMTVIFLFAAYILEAILYKVLEIEESEFNYLNFSEFFNILNYFLLEIIKLYLIILLQEIT